MTSWPSKLEVDVAAQVQPRQSTDELGRIEDLAELDDWDIADGKGLGVDIGSGDDEVGSDQR